MTPNQPYLLRAFYEWIVDNQLTPHIVVDAKVDGVDVPQEHVKDGQIILNISPTACGELLIQNDWVSFKARFSGVARELFVPVPAVLAIFARENGAGTVFMDEETQGDLTQDKPMSEKAEPLSNTEAVTSVNAESDEAESVSVSVETDTDNHATKPTVKKLKSVGKPVDSSNKSDASDEKAPSKPPRPKGKPSLKVIK